jgi:hypothetical protein
MEHLEDVDTYRPVHICSLLSDAVSSSEHMYHRIVSRLMNELERIRKETAVAYFRVPFQQSHGGAEESHENLRFETGTFQIQVRIIKINSIQCDFNFNKDTCDRPE